MAQLHRMTPGAPAGLLPQRAQLWIRVVAEVPCSSAGGDTTNATSAPAELTLGCHNEAVGAVTLTASGCASTGGSAALPSSPAWSSVEKDGRQRKNQCKDQTAPAIQHSVKSTLRRQKHMVGTSVQESIKVVQTK